MKNVFKKAALLGCMAVFGFGIATAQETDKKEIRKKARTEFRASLTDAQKTMLKKQEGVKAEYKEAMSATYTEQQLALLENKETNSRETRKKLKATMTPEQIALKKSEREDLKKGREAFKATLSEDQKAAYKEINKRPGKKGKGLKGEGKRKRNGKKALEND